MHIDDIRELQKQVEEHVTLVLQKDLPKGMVYHSLEHTLCVVAAAKEIGQNSELTAEEMEILEFAAWFHDIGYKNTYENHEQESAKIAKEYLIITGYPEEKAEKVYAGIMATKMPQIPHNKLEMVLCDADLQHLGTKEYSRLAKLLLQEMNTFCEHEIPEGKWMQMNLEFIDKHSYFTDYAQQTLDAQKQKNRKKVNKKFKKIDNPEILSYLKQIEELEKKVNKSKAKSNRPDRGIETMFRLTSKNHLDLSSMADNKANIMISVNSIILSILLTVLLRKLDELPHFLIPTVILMGVCLTTIVFAILATRPHVSHGKFTRDNIVNKETNLLFFGLRISYTIFMFGFVLAVISFIIAEAFFKPAIPF